jgi:hypothetical protein
MWISTQPRLAAHISAARSSTCTWSISSPLCRTVSASVTQSGVPAGGRFWKKRWPCTPSGVRTKLAARSLMYGSSTSATVA